MKLYCFPVAPNPTRVRLYIAEKRAGGAQIDVSEEWVNLQKGEQKSSEHLARNPFGNLPVLELDDGSFLRESLAIIEYLEELHPEPPMIGTDPATRARARMLERVTEMGVLGPISRLVHATNSPLGWPPNPGVAEHSREALPPALAVIDAELSDGRPFVTGSTPTVADCTLASAFQFARFRKVEVELAPSYPHLARWNEAYRARPTAQTVLIG